MDLMTALFTIAGVCITAIGAHHVGVMDERRRMAPLAKMVLPVLEAHYDRAAHRALVTYEFDYDDLGNENFGATVVSEIKKVSK